MRYRFTFEKNIKNDVLTVFEAGEIDNNYVVMYEGTYGLKEMAQASEKGADQFISKLRKKNFFPDALISSKLYEATMDFFSSKSEDKIVVNYEDAESLAAEEIVEEVLEVDALLAEDDDDISEDAIKEIDMDDDTPKFKPEDNSEHED